MGVRASRRISEIFNLIFFLALIFGVLLGCSKTAPDCNDAQVKNLTIELIGNAIQKKLSSVYTKQQVIRYMQKISLNLEAVRTTSVNKETGCRVCTAELIMQGDKGENRLPIEYKSELIDGGKNSYVSTRIYGISDSLWKVGKFPAPWTSEALIEITAGAQSLLAETASLRKDRLLKSKDEFFGACLNIFRKPYDMAGYDLDESIVQLALDVEANPQFLDNVWILSSTPALFTAQLACNYIYVFRKDVDFSKHMAKTTIDAMHALCKNRR